MFVEGQDQNGDGHLSPSAARARPMRSSRRRHPQIHPAPTARPSRLLLARSFRPEAQLGHGEVVANHLRGRRVAARLLQQRQRRLELAALEAHPADRVEERVIVGSREGVGQIACPIGIRLVGPVSRQQHGQIVGSDRCGPPGLPLVEGLVRSDGFVRMTAEFEHRGRLRHERQLWGASFKADQYHRALHPSRR